jgi:hypothetical protein
MMAQCAQMGFSFPKHPYVGYTSGNYTNDEMEQTPAQIRKDSDIIAVQYKEMIDNQIQTIRCLKLYDKSKKF